MSVFQIDPETYLVATASRDLSVGLHILKKLKMNTVAMLNNASEGIFSFCLYCCNRLWYARRDFRNPIRSLRLYHRYWVSGLVYQFL